MTVKPRFQPGDRVRLNLPGSKLHGATGTLKSPRPPAGWWLVDGDRVLELEDGSDDADRSFIAPDLWLELIERPAPAQAAPLELVHHVGSRSRRKSARS